MQSVNREQVQTMMRTEPNLRVLDVLSADSYRDYHIPGALNTPVDGDFERLVRKAAPNKDEPVIVYCYDSDCDASPKAAERMEEMGYNRVFDYEAGKVDWKEAGLATE